MLLPFARELKPRSWFLLLLLLILFSSEGFRRCGTLRFFLDYVEHGDGNINRVCDVMFPAGDGNRGG